MSLPVPLSVTLQTPRGVRRVTKELRDLRFRESVPGGFASAVAPLDRPLTLQPDEIAYYGQLTVVDSRNGDIVWDGRLEDPARSVGADGQVWELAALGPSAHVHDRTVPLIYVDGDLGSLTRAANSNPGGRDSVADDPDSGNPAIMLQFPTGMSITTNDRVTVRYLRINSAGQKLARIAVTVDAGRSDTAMQRQIIASTGPGGAADTVASVNFSTLPATAGGVVVTNFADGRDTVDLRINRSGAALVVPDDTFWASLRSLTIRAMLKDAEGNDITTGYSANSVLAHEVVADLLGRLLTEFDGGTATVATTTHAITRLAYPDGVTAGKVFDDLMLFEPDFYWAAWERRLTSGKHRFEWTQWPTEVRYEATAEDGYDSVGSADGLYDAVRVRWRDSNGEIRTTRVTQTVPELTVAGITREAFIDLGDEVGSGANATRAGQQFLIQHLSAPNAGRLTVARPIMDHILGRPVMPWEIHAGHLIRVRGVLPRVDALNATVRDGATVFRIRAKEFTAARAAATVELDSSPLTVAHALAQLRRRAAVRRR